MKLRNAVAAGLLLALVGSLDARAEEESPTSAETKKQRESVWRSIGRHPDADRLRALFKKNEDEMGSGMTLTYVEAIQQMNNGHFEDSLSLIRRGAYQRDGETSYYRDLKRQLCQALARRSMEVVPHLIRELDPNGQPTWIVYCLGLCGDRRAVAPLLEYGEKEKNSWVQEDIRAALAHIREESEVR